MGLSAGSRAESSGASGRKAGYRGLEGRRWKAVGKEPGTSQGKSAFGDFFLDREGALWVFYRGHAGFFFHRGARELFIRPVFKSK